MSDSESNTSEIEFDTSDEELFNAFCGRPNTSVKEPLPKAPINNEYAKLMYEYTKNYVCGNAVRKMKPVDDNQCDCDACEEEDASCQCDKRYEAFMETYSSIRWSKYDDSHIADFDVNDFFDCLAYFQRQHFAKLGYMIHGGNFSMGGGVASKTILFMIGAHIAAMFC